MKTLHVAAAMILPGAVVHFFCGATAGVCGNATGGLKGAVVGSFVHGIVVTFLAAGLYPIMGALGFVGTTFSDADFTVVGIIFGLFGLQFAYARRWKFFFAHWAALIATLFFPLVFTVCLGLWFGSIFFMIDIKTTCKTV